MTIPIAALHCTKACKVNVGFSVNLGVPKTRKAKSAPKLSTTQLAQLSKSSAPKITVTWSTNIGKATKTFMYKLKLAKK